MNATGVQFVRICMEIQVKEKMGGGVYRFRRGATQFERYKLFMEKT